MPSNEVDLGDSSDESGVLDLEAKYRDQMRQIVTQKIDLPLTTLPVLLKEQIKLNPEFQRRDRWDERRQSRLIESLIMNVPIPPVFLGEDEYGFYVVLDGRQRLTAISKFLENDLTLTGLEVWSELNGASFSDLKRRGLDKYLTRRFIPGTVILKESSSVVKYDVFDRLNTGGVQANEMEIRNAVYRGKFTDQLQVLGRHPDFCRLWRIPLDVIEAERNRIYREMEDVELVLRFFALREFERMASGFKSYLTEFLAERNERYLKEPEALGEDSAVFENAVVNAWRIFGDEAFVKPSSQQKSAPYSDAVMVSLSDFTPAQFSAEKDKAIVAAFKRLVNEETFSRAITSGTNGKGAIGTRVGMAKEVVRQIVSGNA
jgi:hypothetical protein